jgi:2-keto-4-pentenoate hydratase/2-oxohepta-3-ene-1,7-dioic acid hydratase in catechol pathway
MKIFRFQHKNVIRYGVLREENLHPVSGSIYEKFRVGEKGIPISRVVLLAPVAPTKIIGIGRNYKAHSRELGNPVPREPLLFLKPSSAVIGPNALIAYPEISERVDYEGELAVVIKKEARRLSEEAEVDEYILGYACFNDITARDLQIRDVQFTRAKSFDTFASIGPCIATGLDPSALRIKTFLNGKLKQSSSTRNLVFPVPFLIRYVSRVMTLYPGDVIATGTPEGVGPMAPGDRVDVQIEGIGTLSNMVAAQGPRGAVTI